MDLEPQVQGNDVQQRTEEPAQQRRERPADHLDDLQLCDALADPLQVASSGDAPSCAGSPSTGAPVQRCGVDGHDEDCDCDQPTDEATRMEDIRWRVRRNLGGGTPFVDQLRDTLVQALGDWGVMERRAPGLVNRSNYRDIVAQLERTVGMRALVGREVVLIVNMHRRANPGHAASEDTRAAGAQVDRVQVILNEGSIQSVDEADSGGEDQGVEIIRRASQDSSIPVQLRRALSALLDDEAAMRGEAGTYWPSGAMNRIINGQARCGEGDASCPGGRSAHAGRFDPLQVEGVESFGSRVWLRCRGAGFDGETGGNRDADGWYSVFRGDILGIHDNINNGLSELARCSSGEDACEVNFHGTESTAGNPAVGLQMAREIHRLREIDGSLYSCYHERVDAIWGAIPESRR